MVQFPDVPPGEPLTVSASGFVDYLRCPERSSARYRGEFSPTTTRAFTGQLAHAVFARRLRGGPIPPEQFETVCREEIGQRLNPAMRDAGIQRPSVLRPILQEVKALTARFEKLPMDGFAEAEVDLEAEPAEGVRLRGRVDAVFEPGPRLTDWKTGGMGDAEPQLGFYALVWVLSRGPMPEAVEAVSVASGERFTIEPTDAGLQQVADRVGDMVAALRNGWSSGTELDRTAGPWCRHCPILEGCTEGRAAAAVMSSA